MEIQFEFLNKIIDSITEHIVVTDKTGGILFKNKSRSSFGNNNACVAEECDKASSMGDEYGTIARNGISSVINHSEEIFYFEYLCHSPEAKR